MALTLATCVTASRRLAVLLVLVVGCQSWPSNPPFEAAPQVELAYLGQQILPHGYRHAHTTVGGLSGIDYESATGRYWLVSDDRSESGPARFYELELELSLFNKTPDPGHAGVKFLAVHTLQRRDGSPFADVRIDPGRAIDPESIRVHAPSGRLVWASEGERMVKPGEAPVLIDPQIHEMQRSGAFVRSFEIPSRFRASAANRGTRRNLGFEGLAFSPDFRTLWVAMENALLQDGPAASATVGSPTRLLALDYASGRPRGEYVVQVAPIPATPTRVDGFADNGISEILALDAQSLLVLERSYVFGVGNVIRLFLVDLRSATDVTGLDTLAGQRYVPAAKRLVFDFGALGIRVDNLEGMTWGPRLAGGGRTLVLVSDDNFNPRQITQFLAFEVRGL